MPDVSIPATFLATVLAFVLGALWYGPLFGRRWMIAIGLSRETVQERVGPVKTYATTFVLAFLASYVFGLYLGPNPGRAFAVTAGAVIGIFWVATSLATNDLFEGRTMALIAINGGYHAVKFTLMGVAFALLG